MLVDLVQVTTSDGLRLEGILESSDAHGSKPPVDAWLCLHGTGSNFYSATLLGMLAPRLLNLGAAVLRVNTRGHDLVCHIPSTSLGRRLYGAAFERVYESQNDLRAWVELLVARGFQRIGLLGHSLGAVKAVYTLAQNSALPNVVGMVAISPPRLSHSHFLRSPRGEEFRQTIETAENYVQLGRPQELMEVRFPLPYLVSAGSYVDRYGREENYNVLRLIGTVPLPSLFAYGTREMQSDAAFGGMPDALEVLRSPANSLQVAIIDGADHNYSGVQDALANRIDAWLLRGPLAHSRD